MKKLILLFTAIVMLLSFCGKKEKIELMLPAIFSDNMVLQQQTDAPIWGKVTVGEKVTVTTSWGDIVSAKADEFGNWQVKVQTPKAGGPFKVSIASKDKTINYENVMSGEVWVCSGQSNMEMPMQGWPPSDLIEHADEEIAKANYPNMRLFTVTRAISDKPEFDCKGKWSVCTPENVKEFSATAFFYGKKLQQELNVPIGLIHTSWGGTPAEAWTPAEEVVKVEGFEDIVQKIKNAVPQIAKLNNWLAQLPAIDMSQKSGDDKWKDLEFNDADLGNANFDASKWKTMDLPGKWEEKEVGNFDGVIWFRKEIKLKKMDSDYVLELGPIDDMDITFVNGKKVGGYETDGFWQVNRKYTVPKDLIVDGKNVIAVRVVDTQGGGGIWGKPEEMKLYPASDEAKIVSLAGEWKYLPVAEYKSNNFLVYGLGKSSYASRPQLDISLDAYTATTLFNAMINPLVPYGIKGAIWYQGEANVGRAEQYKKLFPVMIQSWRKYWKQGDFPFYFVQIAPWEYGQPDRSQYLREAQMKTLSLINTGMAVTTDIGNPANIHPGKKLEVGERLARWALNKDYGFADVVPSGPIYKSMKIEDNKIRIYFDYADIGLKCDGDELTYFLIADVNKEFVSAKAKIDGNSVLVWSNEVDEPIAVRFGWTNIAEPNLFNEVGLPASPFRTDNWK